MSEEQGAARHKDIKRTWARIQRGGEDALATSADFGRLALYAYVEAQVRPIDDSAADLAALGTLAALQKLAHVQAVAAEQQTVQHLLQFAALEGLGISLHLRQQAAQAAADALGLAEGEPEGPPAAADDTPGGLDLNKW